MARNIVVSANLAVVDVNNVVQRDLSDALVAGSVSLDLDRDVKLQAQLTIRDPAQIQPLTDLLRLTVTYTDAVTGQSTTWPLGTYVITTPAAQIANNWATGEFQGDDLTAWLDTSIYTTVHNVSSGTNVVSEIANTITSAGLTRYALPAATRTFRKNWSFGPGTSRLTKINRILDHISWTRLFMTPDGLLTTPGRYVTPRQQQPSATWTEDDLLDFATYTPPDAPIWNTVVVVRDDPSEQVLIGVAQNTDPASRSSTVRTGRVIGPPEPIVVSDLHSQQDADAYAQRLLLEAQQRYEKLQLTVMPNPQLLTPYQNVKLNLSGELARFNGVWRIRGVTLGVTPQDAAMRVELSRVLFDDGSYP